MRVQDCEVCEKKVCIEDVERFNYAEDGDGPFCDQCWFFIKLIQKLRLHSDLLEERINDLERTTAPLRSKKTGPYDAGARRVRRPQR